MSTKQLVLYIAILLSSLQGHGQEVPIQNYSVNQNGQVLIEVASSSDKYYLLEVRHHPDSAYSQITSITFGNANATTLTEPLKAYPANHYRVTEHEINNPSDADNDDLSDVEESNSMPLTAPLNAATSIPQEHGLISLKTQLDFQSVATTENITPWIEYLDNMQFTKFIIVDFLTDSAQLYFINCNTYGLHSAFANYLGIDHTAPSVKKGQIVWNPAALADNGTLGTFAFNFSSNIIEEFASVQRAHEMIAANMPFLTNNLSYFLTPEDEQLYFENNTLYQNSRVPVLFESDVYAGIDYWGLNQGECFGFLRLMLPGEIPNSRDIVLYESIPNMLPHVGGIITSAIQTPLSHVNLRAIQDNIPNAFIRDPLEIEDISNLVGHYVYFKANQSNYEIREATLEEVNDWYESTRPATSQNPILNLNYKQILPLDSITFDMFDGYGAKTANVATMRTFGFTEGTIPNGFGIPFFYYQEFMSFNNFSSEIEEMLADPIFLADRNYRDSRLAQFRDDIISSSMPQWMIDSLSALQNSFPFGTSIRCRSSTNNEDLPEFSGAGLYDSKTHHPSEGHLSKTIKEVFASLWNLRAFDEREFSRVNHYQSSMGILCHPNFEDEKVNGVGISTDPIYFTENTFYLNSQLGEELITNPNAAFPEEILLQGDAENVEDIVVIQYSGLIEEDTLLMTFSQLELLQHYLSEIHHRFEILYNAETNPTFAVDIEYKITFDNQLIIKQARPWVSYKPFPKENETISFDELTIFPNPTTQLFQLSCSTCGESAIQITDVNGRAVSQFSLDFSIQPNHTINVHHLPTGIYILRSQDKVKGSKTIKFIKY